MIRNFSTIIFSPEIACFSEEFDKCKELLKTTDTAKYTNESGFSVMCFRGGSADDITIIISCP